MSPPYSSLSGRWAYRYMYVHVHMIEVCDDIIWYKDLEPSTQMYADPTLAWWCHQHLGNHTEHLTWGVDVDPES